MAGQNGKKTNSLEESITEQLQSNPFGFDFFRALRSLENFYKSRPKIGTTVSPKQEPMRFGQKPDLAFPTSTLESFEEQSGGRPPKLNVRFFGLFGSNGPLPIQFTDFVSERMRNVRDTTLSAFLDIFHHRLISLFYRAWAVNQKSVDYDRPDESRFPIYIGSVFGGNHRNSEPKDSLPPNAKLFYSGHLSGKTQNAEGLESIISDFFDIPTNVDSFIGQWLVVPKKYRSQLGHSEDCASLGINSMLGEKIWEINNRFRIQLGPMDLSRFETFLPTEASFKNLSDWVAFYTSSQFQWDVQLILKAADIPPIQLGGNSRLGWTTWLKSQPSPTDSFDLILDRSEILSEKFT
jgi:type VI secretion system protein ImpH